MSHPVVIRAAKLSTVANIKASGRHTWRERETPNADPARTASNQDWRPVSTADQLADAVAARVKLATEQAKDPVLCIEYLVTAKAEAFKEHGGAVDSERYFRDALAWLEARHGKENIVAVNVQRDEKTPHLVVYAVPLVETEAKTRKRSVIVGTNPDGSKRRETREFKQDGAVRLSAAHFLNGRDKLSQLQTDFADEVGQRHGLVRGVERSRAQHQTVRQWYGKLDALDGDPRLKPAKLVPVPDGPGMFTWGEKRRQQQEARERALAENQKAREHNSRRAELMKQLAGRGLAHVTEQARVSQAQDIAYKARAEYGKAKATAEQATATAAELRAELSQVRQARDAALADMGRQAARADAAEQTVEKWKGAAQSLGRELVKNAPQRAEELGLVRKASPEPENRPERDSGPSMRM